MIKKIGEALIKMFLIILKLTIAIAIAVIIGLLILKFLNIELELSYEDGNIVLRNKNVSSNSTYELNVIDDEYPNISEYQEDSYFYLQLDDNAKAIYLAIQDNLENMKSGTYQINFNTRFNTLLNKENRTRNIIR